MAKHLLSILALAIVWLTYSEAASVDTFPSSPLDTEGSGPNPDLEPGSDLEPGRGKPIIDEGGLVPLKPSKPSIERPTPTPVRPDEEVEGSGKLDKEIEGSGEKPTTTKPMPAVTTTKPPKVIVDTSTISIDPEPQRPKSTTAAPRTGIEASGDLGSGSTMSPMEPVTDISGDGFEGSATTTVKVMAPTPFVPTTTAKTRKLTTPKPTTTTSTTTTPKPTPKATPKPTPKPTTTPKPVIITKKPTTTTTTTTTTSKPTTEKPTTTTTTTTTAKPTTKRPTTTTEAELETLAPKPQTPKVVVVIDNNIDPDITDGKDIPGQEDRDEIFEETNMLELSRKRAESEKAMGTAPGITAAIVGGALVALLCAVLLVMFVVYRMKKKDEGSYPLDDSKPHHYKYTKAPSKEFYA